MPNARGQQYSTLQGLEYDLYMASPEWAKVKSCYWAEAGRYCRVAGCETRTGLQVHHHTYDRLGHEQLADLVGLCARHHRLVHQVHDASGRRMSLTLATEKITGLDLSARRPRRHRRAIKRRLVKPVPRQVRMLSLVGTTAPLNKPKGACVCGARILYGQMATVVLHEGSVALRLVDCPGC